MYRHRVYLINLILFLFEYSSTQLNTTYELIDSNTLTVENRLYLNNVTSDLHLMNITCKIKQAYDQIDSDLSASLVLNVTYKPIVEIVINDNNNNNEIKISNQIVYLFKNNINNGNNVVFKCKYNSNPKPNSILWFKNDILIENNDGKYIMNTIQFRFVF